MYGMDGRTISLANTFDPPLCEVLKKLKKLRQKEFKIENLRQKERKRRNQARTGGKQRLRGS